MYEYYCLIGFLFSYKSYNCQKLKILVKIQHNRLSQCFDIIAHIVYIFLLFRILN